MTRHPLPPLPACALLIASAFASAASLASDVGTVERQLLQSERDRCAATLSNDATALGAILADGIIDVWPGGNITTKAQDLADVVTEKTGVCEVDQMKVKVYGNTGVVVGRLTIGSIGATRQLRFTDTYVRLDGRWQVVLSSGTEIR
jgi:hypothetical protein